MQAVAVDPYLTRKTPVGGVEAGQVFDAGLVGQIIQRDYFQARPGTALMQRAQHAATDAAVAVEGDSIGAIGFWHVWHECSQPVGASLLAINV